MPTGATLWSARVDGQAVRPIARDTRLVVPLGFRSEGLRELELVTVEERSAALGSRLGLELARVTVPVLEHQWRLLLPEQHRYRMLASTLRPAPTSAVSGAVSSTESRGSASRHGSPKVAPRVSWTASDSGSVISGSVVDDNRAGLPGVTVSIVSAGHEGGRATHLATDVEGRFRFAGLGAGDYRLVAHLEGFQTVKTNVNLPLRTEAHVELTLPIAAVSEAIVVTSNMGFVSRIPAVYAESESVLGLAAERELRALQQGLVGGVKPLRVEIPESGKLLVLSGALPPVRVGVELEVKAKRKR